MVDIIVDVEKLIKEQKLKKEKLIQLQTKLEIAEQKLKEHKELLKSKGFKSLKELNKAIDKTENEIREFLDKENTDV